MDEDEEIEVNPLTCKSDIFTLGIIFCEYFTGEKPILPGEFKNTWTCVNEGHSVSFSKRLPIQIESLIQKMLSKDPENRPTIGEVFNVLKDVKPEYADSGFSTTSSDKPAVKKPALRFGPGVRPVRTSGSVTGGRTETTDTTKSTFRSSGTDSETKVEPKVGASKLRGSGLKIADK